jgi:hypothetical protein
MQQNLKQWHLPQQLRYKNTQHSNAIHNNTHNNRNNHINTRHNIHKTPLSNAIEQHSMQPLSQQYWSQPHQS